MNAEVEEVVNAESKKIEASSGISENACSRTNSGVETDAELLGTLEPTTIEEKVAGAIGSASIGEEMPATEKSQLPRWKSLTLKDGWFDVYVSDVKDPDRFTVSSVGQCREYNITVKCSYV